MNYRKILLKTFVTIFTLVGLTQVNAYDHQRANSSFQILPDGTKLIQDADGSMIEVYPDGSKMINAVDGTTIQVKADGSKVIHKPDGSQIQVQPPHSH